LPAMSNVATITIELAPTATEDVRALIAERRKSYRPNIRRSSDMGCRSMPYFSLAFASSWRV